MKITTLKKNIIDIVKNYMNKDKYLWIAKLINTKTWSFVLIDILYEHKWIVYEWEYWINDIHEDHFIELFDQELEDFNNGLFRTDELGYILEYIWLYDLSAVFSFIDSKGLYVAYNWNWFFRVYDKENNTKWEIPNKPLLFFTFQEEEKLLSLLLSSHSIF